MVFKKGFSVCFLLVCFFGTLKSQYYTSSQIKLIDSLRTANEGDLYVDTVHRNYYIGLTNGKITKVNLDSSVVAGIVKSQLDTVRGAIFPVWAEESGNLNTNSFEWSYGNGDDSEDSFGVPIAFNCELFAVGLNLYDGSAEVEVYKNGLSTGATTGVGGVGSTTNTLTNPIPFLKGDIVNFRTLTTTGANSGGKVVAWFRILSKIPTYKKFNGTGAPSNTIGLEDDEYLDVSNGDLYLKESSGWVFKLNIKGPSGTNASKYFIQVTNIATGNINAGNVLFSWLNVLPTSQITNNASAFTVATDGVTIVNSGTYKVTVYQYQVATSGQRNNATVRITVNGTAQGGYGANAYQRVASGHDESTSSLVRIVNVASGQKIGFLNEQLADNGNVICPPNSLIFIVEQL